MILLLNIMKNVGDHVRISKYKNIFAKGHAPNWSEELFVIEKKILYLGLSVINVISDLNGDDIIGSFYAKELQKTNQKEFRIEKVIKRTGKKSYVKWKRDSNSFNSWIGKKDLIKLVNTFLYIEALEITLR